MAIQLVLQDNAHSSPRFWQSMTRPLPSDCPIRARAHTPSHPATRTGNDAVLTPHTHAHTHLRIHACALFSFLAFWVFS